MHFPIFQDLLLIFGFSAIIIFALNRLHLPPILGFLITGILIGPHGLSWVQAHEDVEFLSEIGVILLLFVIGMELSIKHLVTIKKTVFIGGSLQVGLTILFTAAISYTLTYELGTSVFIGFLCSLSSTAIVLKVLQDRNELSSPHGRNALGILIFQDVIVVPMILVTPILSGQTSNLAYAVVLLLLKMGGVIFITYLGARYIIPHVLDAVARTNNKELFLITTIVVCMLITFITSVAGLSLALGAFLAGLIISESDYSHQATSSILPFREFFISFFFISIGMLLDLKFFFGNLGYILLILLGVFLFKSLITAVAVAVLKYPPRTHLLTGLALFQIGEFSFILSKTGMEYGLLNSNINQYFLAVSISSMLLTPFIIIFSENMTSRFFRIRMIKFFLARFKHPGKTLKKNRRHPFYHHLIIIGFGVSGRHLAQAAEYKKIPYIVVEINAEIVQAEKKNGIPIIFGDATHEHILESVHISAASAVVVTIPDLSATRSIVSQIHILCPTVYVLARVRYIRDMNSLLALGANDVVPEEFETSIQVFSRVLNNFLIPENEIDEFIETLRTDNYQLFQSRKNSPKTFRPAKFPNFNITSLRITRDSGEIVGKPINEINFRKLYKINILGILRKDKMLNYVHPEEILCPDDILYVQGRPEHISHFQTLIN